jgi:hypothetical protein
MTIAAQSTVTTRVILTSTSGIRRLQTSGLLTEEPLAADQLARGGVGVPPCRVNPRGLVGLVEQDADLRSLEQCHRVRTIRWWHTVQRGPRRVQSAIRKIENAELEVPPEVPGACCARGLECLDRDRRLLKAHRQVAKVDEFGWAEGPQGSRFPAQRERGGAVALPLTNRREGVDRDQAFGVSSVTSRIEGRASARGAAVPRCQAWGSNSRLMRQPWRRSAARRFSASPSAYSNGRRPASALKRFGAAGCRRTNR